MRRFRAPFAPAWLLPFALLCGAAPAAAQSFCDPASPAPNPCIVIADQDVTTSSAVLSLGARDLVVAAGITITAHPGPLTILAANLTLEPRAAIVVESIQPGLGGTLTVRTPGSIRLKSDLRQSKLDVSSDGQGGEIQLTAGGDIVVEGLLTSKAGRFGFGGLIEVTSTGGNIVFGGELPLSVGGGNQGGGGDVTITTNVGNVTVNSPVDASGGAGGAIVIDAKGDLVVAAPNGELLANATATSDDGGFMQITTGGAITINGLVNGAASGSADGAGSGADIVISAGTNLTIGSTGKIDVTGPSPDGEGGGVDLRAEINLTVNGQILAPGKGEDGCGGDAIFTAKQALTLGPVDLSGGRCGGGTLNAQSDGALLLPANVDLNLDGRRGPAGSATLRGLNVNVAGFVHTIASEGARGGQIKLHGCDLATTSGARVTTTGPMGQNLLRANGTMTVGGEIRATGGAVNTIEYATTLPSITGIVVPATPPALVPGLPPCTGPETGGTTTTTTSSSTSTTGGTLLSTTTSTTTSTTFSTVPTTSSSTSTSTLGTTSTSTSSSTTTRASTSTSTSSTRQTTSTSTSSTSSTSSSTSTSTSSTTSTTRAPECIPGTLPCDDDNLCTDDRCEAGDCVFEPVLGIGAVTCLLATTEGEIGATLPDDVGGAEKKQKLADKVTAVRTLLDSAGAPGTRRYRRTLKRGNVLLGSLIRNVNHRTQVGKIKADVGERILALTQGAKAQLQPLRRP